MEGADMIKDIITDLMIVVFVGIVIKRVLIKLWSDDDEAEEVIKDFKCGFTDNECIGEFTGCNCDECDIYKNEVLGEKK
jgi:hypothetical protein